MINENRRVFVSYVRDNEAQVDELCESLEAAQIPYWRDRNDIAPGDDWKAKIRTAIRSESMIFLACFSEESVARERSTMNEELWIAVEEYRLRPPGTTWIVPVRLSDVELPDWQLGAGRNLSDLDYVSLFGPRKSRESNKLIGLLARLFGSSSSATAAGVAATSQADPAARVEAIRDLVKQWIRDPAAQIQLDDLLTTETSSVVEKLRSAADGEYLGNSTAQLEKLAATAQSLTAQTLPLCAAFQVACRWASESDASPWSSALRRLEQTATEVRAGYEPYLAIRHIPALLVTLTTALAAVGQDRWDLMRVLLVENRFRDPQSQRGSVAIVDSLSQWKPFAQAEQLPQILAKLATADGHDLTQLVESVDSGRVTKLYTPVSEWLHAVLRPIVVDQYPEDVDYDEAFDRAETMIALLSKDQRTKEYGRDAPAWQRSTGWYGRATWRVNAYRSDPIGDIEREIASDLDGWPPLRAGLFGGELNRAREAVSDYSSDFQTLSRQRY